MLRRLALIFALLSLVFQSFGAAVAAWTCEGKTCSLDRAACCCSAPTTARDTTCKASLSTDKACAGRCGCKLTVKSVREPSAFRAASKASVGIPASMDAPAILPFAFALPSAWVLEYAPVLANPPPVLRRPPLLEGAPLRAPPAPFA